MKKRILSLLLAAAMLLSLLPQTALTASAETITGYCGAEGDGTNLAWSFDPDTGVLTVTGSGAMAEDAFSGRVEIQSAVLGSGVTSIGLNSFFGCSAMTAIELPDTLTGIGPGALCSSGLESLTIPASVTELGAFAVNGCNQLQTVTILGAIETIQPWTFAGCPMLESVTLPEGLRQIGNNAFGNCFCLQSLTLPQSLETIDGWAFQRCSALDSVSFPEGLQSIGESAFLFCWSLPELTIPASVGSIGENAFAGCHLQGSVTILSAAAVLGAHAFGYSAVEDEHSSDYSYEPYDVFTVYGYTDSTAEQYAAENSFSFVNIGPDPIPDPISGVCGADGDNLTWTLDFATGILCIEGSGDMANYQDLFDTPWYPHQASIVQIVLSEGVTSIGSCAFESCVNLEQVTLPDSLRTIAWNAFFDCAGLEQITLPAGVEFVSSDAFLGCDQLTDYYVSEDNANFSAIDGVLFDKSGTTLERYPAGRQGAYELPGWVQTIESVAFYCCSGLEAVTIPASVTRIGNGAFQFCGALTGVTVYGADVQFGDTVFGAEQIWDEETGTYTWIMPEGLTVYGLADSTAQAYAAAYGLNFVAIEAPEPTVPVFVAVDDAEALGAGKYVFVYSAGGHNYAMDGSLSELDAPGSFKPVLVDEDGQIVGLEQRSLQGPLSDFWFQYDGEKLISASGQVLGMRLSSDGIDGQGGVTLSLDENGYVLVTAEGGGVLRFNDDPNEMRFGFYQPSSPVHTGLKAYKELALPVGESHNWSTTVYEWDDGYSRITASRYCLNNPLYTQIETVRASVEATWPTCTEGGQYVATAVFANPAFETQVYTLIYAPRGHKWGEAGYTWSEDNLRCTATRSCQRSGCGFTETETVETSFEVTVEATQDTEGLITYTAVFTNPAFPTQTKQVVTPPLGANDPDHPFTDVSAQAYYYAPVLWAYNHDPQITVGTSDTSFSPNRPCTRAQIVTFLYRACADAAYQPGDSALPFHDVGQNAYYRDAVRWAWEQNITCGSSAGSFSPHRACTRAEAVTFLWRAGGSPAPTLTEMPFDDVPADAWYAAAVLWAYENGITAGTSANRFSPHLTCTRAQIISFLWRYSGSPAPTANSDPANDPS